MVFVDWLNCRAVVTSYAVTGLHAVGQWLLGATGMILRCRTTGLPMDARRASLDECEGVKR